MSFADHFTTWLEIDLEAIRGNIRRSRAITGVQVMAVVKANAYGHGIAPASAAAIEAGAAWCGVARVEEAVELRRAGIEAPILVLGATPAGMMREAVMGGISLAVWDRDQLQAAEAAAGGAGVRARLHLKVDTGMTRLGAEPGAALEIARAIAASRSLVFEGLFTHFARADEPSEPTTEIQARRFREVVAAVEGAGLRPPLIHAANTAAAFCHPDTRFDLVRLGVGVYGLHPSAQCTLPSGFRPALSWKAQLTQVRTIEAGTGVSYGHVYVSRKKERVGVVPVGYADGMRRVEGNRVLVGGTAVPVVGRVCMDQCMVLLDEVPGSRAGDEVVILGEQQGTRQSAEEIARRWGTINYEVTTALSARVPRVYVGS
jgi:alanine racemase